MNSTARGILAGNFFPDRALVGLYPSTSIVNHYAKVTDKPEIKVMGGDGFIPRNNPGEVPQLVTNFACPKEVRVDGSSHNGKKWHVASTSIHFFENYKG